MCLLSDSKSEIKIAEKDMVMYKCLDEKEEGKYFAPIQHYFEYVLGQSYQLEDPLTESGPGFYGYMDEESIIRDFAIFDKNDVIVKFIIPKGSFYYTGTFNQVQNKAIVSSAIIFDSIIGEPKERVKELGINITECVYYKSGLLGVEP